MTGVEALDRATAADSLPGVSGVTTSFTIILTLAFVVVTLVVGIFFVILTVQKSTSLTLLRAIGADAGFLTRSLLVQVVAVVLGGIVFGAVTPGARCAGVEPQLPDLVRALDRGQSRRRGHGPRHRRVTRRDPSRAAHRSGRGDSVDGSRTMRLALRELRRSTRRFVPTTAALALLVMLLLFLGGLLDGLYLGSTGALRAEDADLVVYSESSRDSVIRSRIDPELRAEIESVPGVRRTSGLGFALVGARVPGRARSRTQPSPATRGRSRASPRRRHRVRPGPIVSSKPRVSTRATCCSWVRHAYR